EMAIIYRHQYQGDRLAHALEQCDIPHALAHGRGKRELFDHGDGVKLLTMHSSKGLEFPFVAIPDLGALPQPEADEQAEARLLYVAMTRATEQLLLLHLRESAFTRRIRASIHSAEEE